MAGGGWLVRRAVRGCLGWWVGPRPGTAGGSSDSGAIKQSVHALLALQATMAGRWGRKGKGQRVEE